MWKAAEWSGRVDTIGFLRLLKGIEIGYSFKKQLPVLSGK